MAKDKTEAEKPIITKELIQTRIKILEEQRDLSKANTLAFEAAVQDCTYWLSVLKDV